MIGMLWFDNSRSSLANKIAKALTYYRGKYGKLPVAVYVHPDDLEPDCQPDGLRVKTSGQVQRNHLFLVTNTTQQEG